MCVQSMARAAADRPRKRDESLVHNRKTAVTAAILAGAKLMNSALMNLSSDKLRIIADYFRSRAVHAVYLFGSYARGDAISESDIDLLLDTNFGAVPICLAACKRDLDLLLLARVDICQLHKLPRFARKSVSKERILLYELDDITTFTVSPNSLRNHQSTQKNSHSQKIQKNTHHQRSQKNP